MQTDVDIAGLLGQCALTQAMSQSGRQSLAEQCDLAAVEAKQRLRAVDLVSHHVYLIEGQMATLVNKATQKLAAEPGVSPPIPLFSGGDSNAVAATLSRCVLLLIPVEALANLSANQLAVSDVEISSTETNVLNEIYDLISNKRLELPSRPEVALRIQELTQDSNSGLDELTEVIQRDPTVAGGLLHATNSPLFRASVPIQSVRDAVLRLGFRNTRMLTTNLALRQTFNARQPVTRDAMQQVWAESIAYSALSFLIADSTKLLNRERALLAGLIANIGAVPIIQYLEKRTRNLDHAYIDALIPKLRAVVGILVINYWGLGEDLVAVAEHAFDWGYQASEPDYVSIVIVARWAALQNAGQPVPPAESVPAFQKLGIDPPPEGGAIAFLAARERELRALKMMFNL